MKRRLLLTLLLTGFVIVGWAQHEGKYSASTLMFLSEQRGEIQLPKGNAKVPLTIASALPFGADEIAKEKTYKKRKIADVEQIGGVDMISAFIVTKDNSFSNLKSLGVVIQSEFKNMVAALIPVDKIADVAALDNVTKIEVAEVLEPTNDLQRSATQAGDAITNSAAAQALGLSKQYTGKDVILGIIDTGIDFQHIAFKDASGNSRIVRAYMLSGSNSTSLTTYSSASQISGLTYDTNAEDHGTHTSTTAGGSSVIVNGSNVTVTNDHANATYGGMAPEANLVIAGLSSLYTTSIGTAIQNICNYADQVGKPCVISLSLGSQMGPHDGTGTIASIVDQYAGDNHIIVYAASNDGMRAAPFVEMGVNSGGGMYASGTSTSSKPMIVNVQRAFSNADGNVEMLSPTITAYARTAGVPTSLKFHVVNVNTGAIVYSSSAYTSSTTISVTGSSGLAQYFKSSTSYQNQYGDAGSIRLVRTQDTSNNKYYWQIYCPIMLSTSYADNDDDGVYNSNYAFCVSVYPTSSTASTTIDMWEEYASWFGTDLNLSSTSYNYCPGNDDCSVSDNACYSKVISVGAYVTRNSVTDYAGTAHDFTSDYPNIGDHASFSSWQTQGYGPLGTPLPHINAPGARIIAGVNHYHTASVDDYSYWSDDYIGDLVVNNSNYPYAAMEGTSMATPCVSGIIAQWLQACVEAGKTPTPDYIKEVMAATWDTDEWTNGTGSGAHGAKTFGTHGKINAIKGIQYILGASSGPAIHANPTTLEFTGYATVPQTKTITVTGTNLEGNITVSRTGSTVYSVNKTTITAAEAANGVELTVTWSPTTTGTTTGTITLSSSNAESVTINLTGTAEAATPTIIADKEELNFTAQLNQEKTETINVTGRFLTGNITATLTGDTDVFSVLPATATADAVNSEEGATFTVTFNATEEGTYTGTLTLTGTGAQTVTISLTATANDGGTASDAYLNIAKYATIDEAGWRTALVDHLYKYTEYEDNQVAWLTLPIYGGFVGARYATNSSTIGSGQPQKWIETTLSNSNTYGGTTWTSNASVTNPFFGSSAYFTSATARAIGYDSRTNTSIRNVSFYVTNTTAVKVSGKGRNGSSTNYPAALKVYECTENDGTVTSSSTATKNVTSSLTSTFTLTADGLNAAKIYKVEASIYRGYLYEIAFQTPLPQNPDPVVETSLEGATSITEAPIAVGTSETTELTITGHNLQSDVTVTLSDENGVFSISKQTSQSTNSTLDTNDITTKGTATTTTLNISAEEAESGATIAIGFAPTTAGEFTATLTLSTKGVDNQEIQLTGTGLQPYITATEQLTFENGTVGESMTDVIEVLADNLVDDITVTLNDENGVFSLDKTSISKAEAEEGATVNVTFTPTEARDYTATVTLTSPNAEAVTVNLTGSATPAYFDVTIGSYGLTTLYLDFPVEIPYDNPDYYPDLLGVYFGYSIVNNALKLARIDNVIPANTGVIVQGNAGTYRFPKSTNSNYELPFTNYLTGSTVAITPAAALEAAQSDGAVYTMNIGKNAYIGFYRFTGSMLAANKAFLIYNATQSKDFFISIGGDGVATHINSLQADSPSDTWFTPQGVQINGSPTHPGVYIHQGKKRLIK